MRLLSTTVLVGIGLALVSDARPLELSSSGDRDLPAPAEHSIIAHLEGLPACYVCLPSASALSLVSSLVPPFQFTVFFNNLSEGPMISVVPECTIG
jgi:hypothetical protein